MAQKYYGRVAEFDNGIAVGGSASKTLKIDAGYPFVIESIQAMVIGASDDIPLAWDTSPTTNDNDRSAFIEQIRIQIEVNSDPWFSDPVPLKLLVGDGRNPHGFFTKPVIPQGADLKITAYNRSADNVSLVLFFEGAKLQG